MENSTLIFLHIPKTAGNTLAAILRRQFQEDKIFRIEDNQRAEELLQRLPESSKEGKRLVYGHIAFGLHNCFSGDSSYITMLRDPVDRIISHYYYVLRSPEHYLHEKVVSNNMSLETYVRSGISSEFDNGQTRLLCGVKAVDSIHGHAPVTFDILQKAKENLREYFPVVGILERFDDSVLLLKKVLGWQSVYYVRKNVTGGRPTRKAVPRETREFIAERNRYDMALYQFAQARLKDLLEEQEWRWQLERQGFPWFNALYAVRSRAYNLLKSFSLQVRPGARGQ